MFYKAEDILAERNLKYWQCFSGEDKQNLACVH